MTSLFPALLAFRQPRTAPNPWSVR